MENFKKLQKLLNERDWERDSEQYWTAFNVEFITDRYILQIVDVDDIRHGIMPEVYSYYTLNELALRFKPIFIQKEYEFKKNLYDEEDEIYFWQEVKEVVNSILEEETKEK